jgi:hypothetical protein
MKKPKYKYLERMPAALKLVRQGMNGKAASEAVGLTSGAVYRNKDYKAIMAARKADK